MIKTQIYSCLAVHNSYCPEREIIERLRIIFMPNGKW